MEFTNKLGNNFEQVKTLDEIPDIFLAEILRVSFINGTREYNKLTKIIGNINEGEEEGKKASRELLDYFFEINDLKEEKIIELYNLSLSQGIDFDEETKTLLNNNIVLTKKKFKEQNKEDRTGHHSNNSFNEFINNTTFKLILEDIIQEKNEILSDITIYDSSEYIDIKGGADYQVIIKMKNSKTLFFGIDLKNWQSLDNEKLDYKEFYPITLKGDGKQYDYGEVLSFINKTKQVNRREVYKINIIPEEQEKINRIFLKAENIYDLQLSELLSEDVKNDLKQYLEKVIEKEINKKNGQDETNETINYVLTSQENAQAKQEENKRKEEEKIKREKEIEIRKREKEKRRQEKKKQKKLRIKKEIIKKQK